MRVELANVASSPRTVRTYAADVFSIINGGFGGRLRDAPPTGMTEWLEYQPEVLDLDAGERVRRSIAIAVPADAIPGEHITSIVLENDEPIRGSGPVAIDEVIRQAVAVVVTVPGRRLPELTIGAARHLIVADRSTVSIAIANPGNVRLKPVVSFTLFDAAGARVSHATVPMDTVYAWTDTSIEVPLASLLEPGIYTIRLSLDDADQGAHADAAAIELVVEAPPPDALVGAPGTGLAPVDQGGPAVPTDLAWLATALGGGLVLAGLAGLGAAYFVGRRRRVGIGLPR